MAERESPAELGYRLPAEWEEHVATWLSWPHNRETWPGKFAPVPARFAQLVRTLAAFEPVQVLAGGEAVMREAREHLAGTANLTLHDIPTNDAWARDHGPTFLQGPPGVAPALVDWRYNAWGGKYPPYDLDDAVPRRIAERSGYRRFAVDMVMEGGAIDSNGRGTLLASETCLLHPGRNPGRTRAEIESCLTAYCGVRQVLWLTGEMAGDDTDGHVDQLARFVAPTTVVAAVESDPSDVNYGPLQENLRHLRRLSDQDGRPLEIVELPMPAPISFAGQRLPASYVNFYIANGVVVVPQFDDPADAVARETLSALFPDRQVRGLPATDIVLGLGALHCLTQQQPRANRPAA